VVQRPLLYLGEINDSQELAWRKSIAVLEEEPRYGIRFQFALRSSPPIWEARDVCHFLLHEESHAPSGRQECIELVN